MDKGARMKSVIVTGGSGKAGRAAIRELLKHGYQVMNVDIAAPAEQLCHFMRTDLNDLGQVVDALRLAAGTIDRRRASIGEPSAVIHLAGIPAPGLAPDATIFQNNMMTTYNVFSAAIRAGAMRACEKGSWGAWWRGGMLPRPAVLGSRQMSRGQRISRLRQAKR